MYSRKSLTTVNSVFWISAIIVAGFVLWGVFSPQSLAIATSIVFNFTTYSFGWFYLLSVLFFVLFCIFLAISRFGKIKLGKDEDKPEYSFFTWIGMLFSAGFGVGLVFWGVAEPMEHFFNPPMNEIPLSSGSARLAMRYSFFHWGMHQWSVFAIVGLALGYFQFRYKQESLISTTLNPLIGVNNHNRIRKTIDILAVIATVAGVATSLGMGVLQINGGLNYVFSIPSNTYVQLIIISLLLVLYLTSSTTGLNRGIKYLSNFNLALALGLMTFVLVTGPTVFILNSFTLALGDYIQRFFEMSLRLTPYSGGHWVRDWTVFYWAWAIAWSPFVGAFIARVSRGRTIRQFVFGVLIVPPLIALLWMAIFGGAALQLDLAQNATLAQAVHNDVASGLFALLNNFPLSYLLSIVSLLLIFTFLVTSADSATFVLGMMTTNGDLNPGMVVKIVWGTLIAAIAAVLIISSGLQGLQSASLITALPFTFILILMSISMFKAFKKEMIGLPKGKG